MDRKRATARRIHTQALVLTRDRGLDGWTMDDLADAADVSRRTLFNYVAGKSAAVLGPPPELADDVVAVFVGGGPTGRVVDDLAALARVVLSESDFDRDTVRLRREVVAATPRLLATLHENVEALFAQARDAIIEREGTDFGAHRADLAVRLLVTVVDTAVLEALADGETRSVVELLDEALLDARSLFA